MFVARIRRLHHAARLTLVALVIGLISTGCQQPQQKQSAPKRPRSYDYPVAPRSDQVDDYHGVKVADPFRPLENPDAPETREWIAKENEITFGYLNNIPERAAIKERLTTLWDYEKYGVPSTYVDRFFFTKNDGLQNQDVLYMMRGINGTPKMILDPNTFSEDGTVSLSRWKPSNDGKLLAYAVSKAGSDWNEWFVKTIDTGVKHKDHLKWVKFSSIAWTPDNKGFYYSRYEEPNEDTKFEDLNYNQKLYYHRLGSKQSVDVLIYERPDQKEWGYYSSVTDDGKYLIINVSKGTERKNMVFYQDLSHPANEIVELIDTFEAQFSLIDNDGPVFWFRTDLDAPRGRVIAVDTRNPDRANWRELIPESKDTLRGVSCVGDRFIAGYLKDAQSEIKVFYTDGTFSRNVDLPGIGSVSGFYGKRKDYLTFYAHTGYTSPKTIYRYDVANGTSTVFKKPAVDIDPEQFVTKQVFYKSKDGTRVPMFLTHKKGMQLDGTNPVLLYGYGGFNIPITPSFRVARHVWVEMGGVYAVANIRGGGEYGKAWHEAGMKLNRQNVFDDFIAAGEWLVDNKYTSPKKLAIFGGSNGGLLVGACMIQRPDLFGAAIPAVGVMDMLRFHKFTIGWAWVSDYGSPDNPEEFKALHAYSPLHTLEDGVTYPSTLITTADHDDRVVPAHSFKFAARLQEAHAGDNPVLIRIQTSAGHGAGKPTSMRIDEAADMWAFLVKELDITPEL